MARTAEMLYIGADVCQNLEAASQREWLETNGLGGFASSTIAGLNTRRYHGLLCAAVDPPGGRAMLVSKLEETLIIDGRRYDLSVNHYPGTVHPDGYRYQIAFRLDPFPAYAWRIEEIELSKSIFMVHDSNIVVVEYRLRAQGDVVKRAVSLDVRPLIAYRGYHELASANDFLNGASEVTAGRVSLTPYIGLPTLHVAHDADRIEESGIWYRNFEYQRERERGLDFREDLYQPFVLHFDLGSKTRASIIVSAGEEHREIPDAPELRRAEIARRKALGGSLERAADQFIVRRGQGHSVIAGYPWFADWGRDTMISLPGLTLSTGRQGIAREILAEFSRWLRDGLLPNRFPESGQEPEYNSIDSALGYFEAVRAYGELSGDYSWILDNLYGHLTGMIDSYVRGTHYQVRVESDGLLRAGIPGVAMTWMDARFNGVAVTPRIGKPVEIQALWYSALRVMEDLAQRRDDPVSSYYGSMAGKVREAFQSSFWNEDAGCLFDVMEESDQKDASIRPNQIFAISLRHKLIDGPRALAILNVMERELLTPFGLRTLSPRDSRYRGIYAGGVESRDTAYHQGTAWPWLMGPFVTAYFEAHNRTAAARQRCLEWLSPLRNYRESEGLNQLPEVFDGDAPHRPGGCPAQAWSIATIIQAFQTLY